MKTELVSLSVPPSFLLHILQDDCNDGPKWMNEEVVSQKKVYILFFQNNYFCFVSKSFIVYFSTKLFQLTGLNLRKNI
jgi:hypothetical protein